MQDRFFFVFINSEVAISLTFITLLSLAGFNAEAILHDQILMVFQSGCRSYTVGYNCTPIKQPIHFISKTKSFLFSLYPESLRSIDSKAIRLQNSEL